MSDLSEILDSNLEKTELKLIPAEKGKRFLNYLLDVVFFFFILAIFGIIAALTSDALLGFISDLEANPILDRIITAILYAIYYIVMESALKGKSIGKYLTKTRVVAYDGSTPSLNTFAIRSLSRIVPFEGLSFLGSKPDGWHDRWSETMVIDEKLSTY